MVGLQTRAVLHDPDELRYYPRPRPGLQVRVLGRRLRLVAQELGNPPPRRAAGAGDTPLYHVFMIMTADLTSQ